jgi:uncharacterized integral membrane protein (TIGR00697 family)
MLCSFAHMNEIIFFCQILIICLFALRILKLGKEALVAWVAIQALIANLFVLKQVNLFGFNVTSSDVFVIGSLLGLNFLQEYHSKEIANKATQICFIFMIFFAIVSKAHLLLEPNIYDSSNPAFIQILSPTLRLLISSMSVFFIVQQFDIRFFAFLKNVFPKLNFSFRVTIALIISQFLDTVLFSIAGLYGIVNSILDIMLFSFAIKLIAIFCITPFIRWAKT